MLHLICHKPSERYVISKYNVVIMLCIGMCYLDSKTVQKLPTKFTTLQHLQTCQINLHLSTITILQIGFHNCHPNGLCHGQNNTMTFLQQNVVEHSQQLIKTARKQYRQTQQSNSCPQLVSHKHLTRVAVGARPIFHQAP